METNKFEILIAVMIGLMAGVFITFGVTGKFKDFKFNPWGNKPQKTAISSPATGLTSNPEEKKDADFITLEPITSEYFSTSSAVIKGKTNSKNRILVSSEKEEIINIPDLSGEFEIPLELYPGKNEIEIIAINEKVQINKNLDLYYIPSSN